MKNLFKTILGIALFCYASGVMAQSYNEERTALTNFLTRMYTAKPFEGVKIVEDYDNKYFLSVLSLENAKYPNESTMTRVAQVKAQSQANTFFNGSNIEMDMIMSTTDTEKTDGTKESTTVMIEKIKENSTGFVQGMEQLANFDIEDGKRKLFMYYRKME